MTTTPQNFGPKHYEYPIMSQDDWSTGGGVGFEGAQKRFSTFPDPREVLEYTLLGLPKIFPLTGEVITPDHMRPFLDSAINEIEMDMGMDLSPVERDQSFDYIDGMFTANATGLKLEAWPAVKIIEMQLRFPHTQTQAFYQTYSIPPSWIALRRNRINVLAAYGAVSVNNRGEGTTASAAGVFSYITGFARGAYQPAMISVRYVSGFTPDRLPNIIVDLIKTQAALRFLSDAFAPMFPTNSVSVSIDGVSQSAQSQMNQLLMKRVEMLEKKKEQQKSAVIKTFGRTIKMTFIGA